jgi:hypothetical protein
MKKLSLSLLKLALSPFQWFFVNFCCLYIAGPPMLSTSFRSIVEPILNEVFDGVYTQRKDEYLEVFTERNGTPRAYHEEPVMFGFPMAPELPDGQPVTYEQGGVLYIKRYLYKVYGLAFALTQVLVEDGDHIRLGSIFSEHLGQSMVETKETITANVLNRSFNAAYVGGDGRPLCDALHPISGGTYSNLLTVAAALSQTSVEQMLIQVRSAVSNEGKKIRLQPVKLVCSPSNQFQAEVVIKSVLRSGMANNDINPVRSMGLLSEDTAIISRLTSPTAWWIKTDAKRGLQVMMRRKLKKSMEGDFETDSMRYKSTERYDAAWTEPRAVFGTPGL